MRQQRAEWKLFYTNSFGCGFGRVTIAHGGAYTNIASAGSTSRRINTYFYLTSHIMTSFLFHNTFPSGELVFTTKYSIPHLERIVNMDLGKIMKEERIKQGMSQQTLARKAGVTKRAVIYWENGEKKMNVESADKVFKALHLTVTIGDIK